MSHERGSGPRRSRRHSRRRHRRRSSSSSSSNSDSKESWSKRRRHSSSRSSSRDSTGTSIKHASEKKGSTQRGRGSSHRRVHGRGGRGDSSDSISSRRRRCRRNSKVGSSKDTSKAPEKEGRGGSLRGYDGRGARSSSSDGSGSSSSSSSDSSSSSSSAGNGGSKVERRPRKRKRVPASSSSKRRYRTGSSGGGVGCSDGEAAYDCTADERCNSKRNHRRHGSRRHSHRRDHHIRSGKRHGKEKVFKGEDVGAAATAAASAASAAADDDDDDDRYGMRSTGGNSGDDTDKDSVEGSNASGVLGTPRKKRRKHRGCNAIPSGVDQNKKKKEEKKEKKKKKKKRKKTERERKYSIKEKRVSRKKEGRKKGSPDPSPKNGSRAYESEYKTTSLIRPAADAEDEKQGPKDRASKATGSNTSTTERPGAKNSSRHGTTATGTAGDVLLSCAKDGALAAGVPALTQKQPVVVPLAGIADVHEGDRGVGKARVGRDEDVKAIRARAMVPMRPEEYEAQQNTIREVFDEDTGRWRLIKGTGEIIERIVSRQEQQEIQQHASRWGWDHKTLSQGSARS